jgi:hypothetical protein
MKKRCILWMLIALAAFACQRQQHDAGNNAEMKKKVQQPLAVEHQAKERQELARRASPEVPHTFTSQAQKFHPRRIVPMTSPNIKTPTPTPKSAEPPPRS